jgi:tungstate transport system substrate-binding protein
MSASRTSFFVARDMLSVAYRLGLILVATVALFFVACGSGGGEELILATTTSTYDSGLLDELVPLFEDQNDYNVKIISVGTGQALEMGRRGDADVLLVHAPSSELELVDEGAAINRQLVMHNDFVILGPAADPAGIASARDALEALDLIASAGEPFFSRGDDSGTNKLELALWDELGTDPSGESWYEETGQGMGATLQIVNQRAGYTISDRGTYLSLSDDLDLDVLFEGDPRLLNIYHVMQVNPDMFDDINAEGAAAFVDFMVGDEAQGVIETFRVEEFGEPLFVPDAGKNEADLP